MLKYIYEQIYIDVPARVCMVVYGLQWWIYSVLSLLCSGAGKNLTNYILPSHNNISVDAKIDMHINVRIAISEDYYRQINLLTVTTFE